jgi:hypothetical protein
LPIAQGLTALLDGDEDYAEPKKEFELETLPHIRWQGQEAENESLKNNPPERIVLTENGMFDIVEEEQVQNKATDHEDAEITEEAIETHIPDIISQA